MVPEKTVRTKTRLYDVYPDTGYAFLAYAAGSEVPVHDYERLKARNPGAAAETIETAKAAPEETAKPKLEDLSRAQLMIEAKTRGIEVQSRATRAELIEALERP